MTLDSQVRMQHYLFAHRALPSVTFGQPARMLEVLLGDEAQQMLLNLWEQAGQQAPPSGQVAPRGLGHSLHQLDPLRLLVLVQLPPPQADTEAYFVGLLFETAQPSWAGPSSPKAARCFTLERGSDPFTQQERTVFCEWTSDSSHLNMGDGPPPAAEEFIQAIRSRLPSHAA
ncbi:MAG TPA: hypothetical protein VGE07_27035 [Herpetosiphonaceae bacterium]